MWKVGDMIWQSRTPGGLCLLVREFDNMHDYDQKRGWSHNDYPILRVWHPTEGLIDDPSYYYQTIEEALNVAERFGNNDKMITGSPDI